MTTTSNHSGLQTPQRTTPLPAGDGLSLNTGLSAEENKDILENAYLMLDPQLQPLAPCPTSPESMQVFEQHKKLAQEYLRIETENALLLQRKQELAKELQEAEKQDTSKYMLELREQQSERESLLQLHCNLKRQLEIIRGRTKKSPNKDEPKTGPGGGSKDEWVML